MNIVEVTRKMKPGWKVRSDELEETWILSENGNSLISPFDENIKMPFDSDIWSANDWEIIKEIQWVDFWTAWRARNTEEKKIRSEYWHESVDYDQMIDMGIGSGKISDKEIDGRWEIID